MKILPQPVAFEWDAGNMDKNLHRHNVTNQEAEEVFFNEPAFLFVDERHSITETRHMIWGTTNKGRTLALFFTIRSNKVRVISARDMNRKERRAYAENKRNPSL